MAGRHLTAQAVISVAQFAVAARVLFPATEAVLLVVVRADGHRCAAAARGHGAAHRPRHVHDGVVEPDQRARFTAGHRLPPTPRPRASSPPISTAIPAPVLRRKARGWWSTWQRRRRTAPAAGSSTKTARCPGHTSPCSRTEAGREEPLRRCAPAGQARTFVVRGEAPQLVAPYGPRGQPGNLTADPADPPSPGCPPRSRAVAVGPGTRGRTSGRCPRTHLAALRWRSATQRRADLKAACSGLPSALA